MKCFTLTNAVMSKVVYCASKLKGDEGFYRVKAYEDNKVLFTLEGTESYTKNERIGLVALRDAVLSIQEEGGVIYTDSEYAYDCVKGGDHRKNKDVMHVIKDAMSRRIEVNMVKKGDRRYHSLQKELSLL